MFTVTLSNSGGPLASRTVSSEEQAAQAALELIREAGSLCDGDSITVEEQE